MLAGEGLVVAKGVRYRFIRLEHPVAAIERRPKKRRGILDHIGGTGVRVLPIFRVRVVVELINKGAWNVCGRFHLVGHINAAHALLLSIESL